MKTAETVFSTFSTIKNLSQPVENDFQAVDALILRELSSHIPLIQIITHHIVQSGGKRLRPLVVLLTAHACGYNKGVEHQELAAIVEFIHTATLLHDDVVDKSDLRRGEKTVNAIWGDQASVLVGDFLYSRAFQILAKRSNIPVMKVLVNTTNQIAEGEVWQLMNQNNPDIDETIYYEVIRRKTAQLFSAGTEIGAIIGTKNEPLRKAMTAFGLHLGLAYQITDDLLDYSDDLAEGKATLPLIYAKQKTKPAQAQLIREAIKKGSLDDLKTIIQIIDETKARKYTRQCAIKEAEKARTYLQMLPISIYKDALEALTKFVIYRRY